VSDLITPLFILPIIGSPVIVPLLWVFMSEFEPALLGLAFFLMIDFEVLKVRLFPKEFGELIFRV
jgi:hypothetical protein